MVYSNLGEDSVMDVGKWYMGSVSRTFNLDRSAHARDLQFSKTIFPVSVARLNLVIFGPCFSPVDLLST